MDAAFLNPDSCIVCGTTSNISTELKLSINDSKVIVKVCTEHADDLTPKKARELYEARAVQVDQIIAMAKMAGLVVSLPSDAKQLAVAENTVKPVPRAAPALPPEVVEQDNEPILELKDLSKLDKGVMGVSGTVNNAVVGSHSLGSYNSFNIGLSNPSEHEKAAAISVAEARQHGQAKLAVVEGRAGVPTAIPVMRKDGTGTTNISISKRVDDAVLQRIFKSQAEASKNPLINQTFANGYDIRDCPLCNGNMEIKNRGKMEPCPKCRGTGTLSNFQG